jgi:hypothetical protein
MHTCAAVVTLRHNNIAIQFVFEPKLSQHIPNTTHQSHIETKLCVCVLCVCSVRRRFFSKERGQQLGGQAAKYGDECTRGGPDMMEECEWHL